MMAAAIALNVQITALNVQDCGERQNIHILKNLMDKKQKAPW